MPVAAANGIEISYTDSGGEGPAVVFSHGYLMDRTMFDRQVTALAPQYRVITWDQRRGRLIQRAGAAQWV
jgi:pimeloyl-ACP methyl ester carboxylesterase